MRGKWEWVIVPTKGAWKGCWYACGGGSSREDARRNAVAVVCDMWREGDLDCPPEECQLLINEL